MAGGRHSSTRNVDERESSNRREPSANPTWNLRRIFASKPLSYQPAPNASKSKGTREPKCFDLHLAEPLRLARIVLWDDFPQALSSLCDRRLSALSQTELLPKTVYKAAKLALAKDKNPPIVNEGSITADYARRTADVCMPIANRAVFKVDDKNWDCSLFQWNAGMNLSKESGLCDGYLTVQESLKVPAKFRLSADTKKEIDLVKRHSLDKFVLIEFKSLFAGDLETMQAILDLTAGGDDLFTWMTCGTYHFDTPQTCNVGKHSKGLRVSVTGRRTGPDSRYNWWDHCKAASGKRKRPAPKAAPCSKGIGHDGPSSTPAPARSKRHAKGAGVRTSEEMSPHKKASYIIQQVWAELVHEDATFAVVNSGNYEIIVRRHRETQTLYMSNLIRCTEVSDPMHYKLHTALYIAGWLDAVDRAKQIEDSLSALPAKLPPLPQDLPKNTPKWFLSYLTELYDDDSNLSKYPTNPFSGDANDQTVADKKQAAAEKDAQIKAALDHLDNAKRIKIRLPHQSMYPSQWEPLIFDRKEIFWEPGSEHSKLNLEVVALNEQPLSPSVWRASIQWECGLARPFFSDELLVIKIAMTDSKREGLRKEYIHHSTFSSWSDTFLRTYGLFTCTLSEDAECDVLILEYGGKPLPDLLNCQRASEAVRQRYCDAILEQALTPLHREGAVHNSLTSDHILYKKKLGKWIFYLVSFQQVVLWTHEQRTDPEDILAFQRALRRDGAAVRLSLGLY